MSEATPGMPDQRRSSPKALVPVYELLAEDIRALGVTTCFGLMSDDTLGLIAALDSMGVQFCSARHETNAVLAAEGYAAATGSLGVALIGRGPALANGMHGIMVASRSGNPVLVISGDAEATSTPNAVGPDYKGFNAASVMTAAGVRAFTASSAETARHILAEAVAAARRGSAVTLHLPASVQNRPVHRSSDMARGSTATAPAPAPGRAQAIDAASHLLGKSRRPVIVAGRGAYRAGAREALEQLAAKTGALIVTSLKAKDMFRGSPYNLGVIGSLSHSLARRFVEQADCVVAFGASLNFLTTSSGAALPDAPIIHVDSNRNSIGRWFMADVAVVGDARIVARQLIDALPESDGAEHPFHSDAVKHAIATFDLGQDFSPAHTARTLDPRSLAMRLNAMLPAKRNLIYDAGNFMMAATYLEVPSPSHFKISSDFASMGAGFGTALGFAKARPDEANVLIIGDGGFMMTLSELESVARNEIALVVVVMNDCAYGAELQICRLRNLPEATSIFPDIDFAPIAEALGFEAATIRTLDDLDRCRAMLQECSSPILLDCKVNADVPAPFMAEYAEAEARKR